MVHVSSQPRDGYGSAPAPGSPRVLEVWLTVPAELSGGMLDIDDVLARLPYLTVHLVELAERQWVADPKTLTCWVDKGASRDQRLRWQREAGVAIMRARPDLAGDVPAAAPRLHSVPW